ncbi:SDR family oxidoreductase [Hymenobacter aerilatus]|uniref:Uncharacterized oxidoreductase YghA n=1 Tax=Hymenobacter aerilatus TaxID=2932251 RepID=A0A8T9SWB1_9BACT|nr:SDR family oxidoreductase [Hymenobacter aerilatus]UOR06358.1 SDR family oxidoreductase [Hymenobacter aerilatus]
MNEENKLSRRQIISGLGASLAVAAVAPVLSAEGATASASAASIPLKDPTSAYPKPPFKVQEQPWPALASKMEPRPDHGETSYKGSGRLKGRKALITGGDSGMGRAAAIAYAREGADVAINYLPAEEPDAKEVVALIKAAGQKAVAIPGDLRDEAFCKKLVDDAVRQLGGLDILVSNAARQQSNESIADITTEQFDWTIKTNIYAPFWLMKAALPHLKPGSAIIATTSVQATDPSANLFDYALTKAADTSMVRSLAKQLGPKGIRVNGVAPGPVWTPLQAAKGGSTPEKQRNFGGDTPLGRPGQPAELAGIYVLLADPLATYANGQIYGSAGGGGLP